MNRRTRITTHLTYFIDENSHTPKLHSTYCSLSMICFLKKTGFMKHPHFHNVVG